MSEESSSVWSFQYPTETTAPNHASPSILDYKRQQFQRIEQERWHRQALSDYHAHARLVTQSTLATHKTQHSVAYNPITLTYAPTVEGARLAARDQAAQERVKWRAKKLYEKNNSFDPIRGVDIEKTMDLNQGWRRHY